MLKIHVYGGVGGNIDWNERKVETRRKGKLQIDETVCEGSFPSSSSSNTFFYLSHLLID